MSSGCPTLSSTVAIVRSTTSCAFDAEALKKKNGTSSARHNRNFLNRKKFFFITLFLFSIYREKLSNISFRKTC